MQTIVLYLCYIVLILLFSTAYNTSLIYCFVIWCLHTNKRRPCSSTLSGHPSSSFSGPLGHHPTNKRRIVAHISSRSTKPISQQGLCWYWWPTHLFFGKLAASSFLVLDSINHWSQHLRASKPQIHVVAWYTILYLDLMSGLDIPRIHTMWGLPVMLDGL